MVFNLFGCQGTPTSNTGGASETPSQGEESGVIELTVWAKPTGAELQELLDTLVKEITASTAG